MYMWVEDTHTTDGLNARTKVQVGNDQEMAQSEIPTPKTEVEEILTIRYLYLEYIS